MTSDTNKDFTLTIPVEEGTTSVTITLKGIYDKLDNIGEVEVTQKGSKND